MLADEIKRININIGGELSSGYTGNDDEFDRIASTVGYPLPAIYKEFLRTADGGHPEVGCFYLQGEDPENSFGVNSFYSISNSSVERIRDALARWGETLGKGALPIGRDGGDNQIYLDLKDASFSVWIYLHDEDGKRLRAADSLESFISGFYIDPDFI